MNQIAVSDDAKIAEYNETERALEALRSKYAGIVFEVATTAGNAAARVARKELVTLRTNLESKRKALKAPALEYAKRIDTEAARIKGQIQSLESPIDAQISADEERRAEERQRKEQVERDRIREIQLRIASIGVNPDGLINASSAEVDAAWNRVNDIEITEDAFAEFADQARTAKIEALDRIASQYELALNRENAEARLKAEREELDRRKAEQDERDRVVAAERAEQDRVVAAERAAEQERMRLEREEIRRQQDELESQRRAIEEERTRSERERLDRENAERIRLENEHAEALRAEQAARELEDRRQAEIRAVRRPSDSALIDVVADAFKHFEPTTDEVIDWIANFDAASARARSIDLAA